MSCKICGGSSCCASFHSLEKHEQFENLNGMTEYELMRLVVSLQDELADATKEIETLKQTIGE